MLDRPWPFQCPFHMHDSTQGNLKHEMNLAQLSVIKQPIYLGEYTLCYLRLWELNMQHSEILLYVSLLNMHIASPLQALSACNAFIWGRC